MRSFVVTRAGRRLSFTESGGGPTDGLQNLAYRAVSPEELERREQEVVRREQELQRWAREVELARSSLGLGGASRLNIANYIDRMHITRQTFARNTWTLPSNSNGFAT